MAIVVGCPPQPRIKISTLTASGIQESSTPRFDKAALWGLDQILEGNDEEKVFFETRGLSAILV
jgi:hypothetical protein